jgi:hypothetical protein
VKEPPKIDEVTAKEIAVEVLPPEPERNSRKQFFARGSFQRSRTAFALACAVIVDAIQIGLFPIFAPGFVSVADIVLDCTAFLLFWRLVGWHPALLPGFIFEQLPIIDLAPSWTLAVWLAGRRSNRMSDAEATKRATAGA